MTELTLQQKAAVFSTDKHVLVSAGAGSGKTHVLVERYVQILRENAELSVANLVAVTFTKKAASEMRTRLKARFQQLFEESADSEKNRWLSCRSAVDGARINTIHSLCESILRSFPVEGGVDPQFEVLDDIERTELMTRCIDHTLREVIASGTEDHELLLAFNIEDIRNWLMKDVLGQSLQYMEASARFRNMTDQSFKEHFATFLGWARKKALRSFLAEPGIMPALRYLEANEFPNKGSEMERIRVRFVEQLGLLRSLFDGVSGSGDVVEASWACLLELSKGNLRGGGQSDEAKELKAAIREIRELARDSARRVPHGMNEEDGAAVRAIASFIRIADRALELYREEKKNSFRLDFDDLIHLTFDALERPESEAKKHYNGLFKAILVDEFQDTNKFQSDLLRLLAGDDTRLFLIGDDKQSIYKFQGADVSIFNYWKNAFSQASDSPDSSVHGEKLNVTLNHSFRSHPGLVTAVNHLFSILLSGDGELEPYRAQFEGLVAFRPKDGSEYRMQVLEVDGTQLTTKERSLNEARMVARWIGEQLGNLPIGGGNDAGGRPARYGDFAILVQKNSDFAALEDSLTEAGIPFVTVGGQSFLKRQEVFDIENLLRFIDNPNDSHSLLGVLRSPMFGISDDIIHAVKSGNQGSLWQLLQEASSQRKDGMQSISHAVVRLRRIMENAEKVPLSELLYRILRDTKYDVVLLSGKNGKQRSRNLWKLVHLAGAHENLSAGQFAARLSLMREYNVKQADAPLETHDVVKLMTIHRSKGLEFPIVILPSLSSNVYTVRSKLLLHRHYGIALNTRREKDEKEPSWFDLARLSDKHMEVEERKRLLYVAMTRARDHVAVILQQTEKEVESFESWLRPLLVPEQAEDGQPVQVDRGNAHWLFRRIDMPDEELAVSLIDPFEDLTREEPEDTEGLRLDLIEPIAPSHDREPPEFRGYARVTPGGAEIKIDPKIVGVFFHALMEHLLHSSKLPDRALIEDIAFAQGEAAAHPEFLKYLANEGERLIVQFSSSSLNDLMLQAKRRFHEMPYLMLVEDEYLNTKRPDLLLEDVNGRWHLIDYKTDHLDESQVNAQAARHFNKQLVPYVRELRDLTGIDCKPAIYFAQLGTLHYMIEGAGHDE